MTPTVVTGLAIGWLAAITLIIAAAVPVGLQAIGAFKAWRKAMEPTIAAVAERSLKNEATLDGVLAGRIAAGAAAVVAVHEAGLAAGHAAPAAIAVVAPVPLLPAAAPAAADPVAAARIAALLAELAALQAGAAVAPAAAAGPNVHPPRVV
jgi:hypothetical protein